MSAIPITKMTLEEYLEFDRTSEGRFEYFDGAIFELSGVSANHAEIESNLITILKNKLAPRGRKVYPSNLGLKVPSLPPFRYPDLSALCGKPVFEEIGGLQRLTNPTLIVEVLSSSTEAFDRGDKFNAYKSIATFEEYLLVSQNRKFVTLYTKHNEKFWFQSDYQAGETLKLVSLDCEIAVDEIYFGVEFSSESDL